MIYFIKKKYYFNSHLENKQKTLIIDNIHMTNCRLRDEFCDTGFDLKSVYYKW